VRGRRRRGQFALLGVIVLAVTLLAIVASRPPEPAFAFERGPMQSAQLIHLARYCLAVGCGNETLRSLVRDLQAYNASEPLLMYPVLDAYYKGDVSSTRAVDHVSFTIQTLRGPEAVEVVVVAQAGFVLNTFSKNYHGVTYILKNTTLTYCHVYTSPFFPPQQNTLLPCPVAHGANAVVYCPRIHDPSGVAEVKQVGPCTWAVAIPIDYNLYTLYDEFGVPVRVVVP